MADFTARKLQSDDGRVTRIVTSQEELEQLKADGGWKAVTAKTAEPTEREPLNSGAEGQRRARASSTTEGQERNTGSTTPSA